jgi:hypothetical protein
VADFTILDISAGVKSTWAAVPALAALIPANRLYFGRSAEGTPLPYAHFEIEDVSAYFGGTEYFSGRFYKKAVHVNFVSHWAATDANLPAYATAVREHLGWTATAPGGAWALPNVVVLASPPDIEKMEMEEERIDGADIVKHESAFFLTLQADRGT